MIYLDYNATAPVAEEVFNAAQPYLKQKFGNPSSGHQKGVEAKTAINKAREQVANAIGATPSEIVFTSGGSESNNMMLKGVFLHPKHFCTGHLIISCLEHAAISKPAEYLRQVGVAVTVIPCNSDGVVSPLDIEKNMRPDTRLVSIMHANNEIGSIQPIAEISAICTKHNVPLHTDASQSIGKTDVNVDKLGVDFLSIAGHKVYAPKGIGALYIRSGQQLHPLIQGVGHEGGLRAGTENVAYQVALGAAMQQVQSYGQKNWNKMGMQRDRFFTLLQKGIGLELSQNADIASRLPNTLSVNFPAITGSELLTKCPSICASTSAACHSGQHTQTVTQKAIGLEPHIAAGTVRFSLGWHTTDQEIEDAAKMLIQAWKQYSTQA